MSITAFRTAIAAALQTEFSVELAGNTVESDRFADAQGFDGVYISVYPDSWGEALMSRGGVDANRREITLAAQFVDLYDPDPELNTPYDTAALEAYEARLVLAVKAVRTTTPWFCRVRGTRFEQDPLGNTTRFTTRITANDDNPFWA